MYIFVIFNFHPSSKHLLCSKVVPFKSFTATVDVPLFPQMLTASALTTYPNFPSPRVYQLLTFPMDIQNYRNKQSHMLVLKCTSYLLQLFSYNIISLKIDYLQLIE